MAFPRTRIGVASCIHRVHTEWRLPISDEHPIMMDRVFDILSSVDIVGIRTQLTFYAPFFEIVRSLRVKDIGSGAHRLLKSPKNALFMPISFALDRNFFRWSLSALAPCAATMPRKILSFLTLCPGAQYFTTKNFSSLKIFVLNKKNFRKFSVEVYNFLNHVFMYITQLVIVVSPSTDNDAWGFCG